MIFFLLNILGTRLFSRKQFYSQDSSTPGSTVVHNEFKFLTFACTLSREVTNMPGKAKVLGLNLTRTCFFCKRLKFRLKKFQAYYLSAYVLSA